MIMAIEKTKQSSATGQSGKQRLIVSTEPTPEGTVAFPRQGIQQGQRHDFTRIEARLPMFGQVPYLVIHLAEQFRDKIDCGHEMGSSPVVWRLQERLSP